MARNRDLSSISVRPPGRSRRLGFLLLPLLSTPVLYLFFWAVNASAYEVRINGAGWRVDLLLQIGIGYLLLAVGRRGWLVVVEQALLMAVLYLGSALKIAMMGWPVTPDDLSSIVELTRVLPGPLKVAALLPATGFAVAVAANLRLRRVAAVAWVAAIALIGLAAHWPGTALRVLDSAVPHSIWNQSANYRQRGATLYLVSEVLHSRAAGGLQAPSRADVVAAVEGLRTDAPPAAKPPPQQPRNLYVVVLESFWDPSLLSRAGFDRDPWFAGFRKLIDRGGPSWALSPEFGGATANPELEVLCGIPTRLVLPGIAFKTSLKNHLPCVPALLARRGWETWAFHPNVPDFWNRSHAYRRVGFEHYLARPDLELDDMNGPNLSDASLYRQALAHARPFSACQPAMTYVMTLTGHWPYPLNAKIRPAVVHATSKVADVAAYANSVFYSSRELDELVGNVLEHDPRALIVALGDHLPVLGVKLAGYLESGIVPSAWAGDFTAEQARRLTSTPLLLVDGETGPVRVGTVCEYDLPRLLLPRLGIQPPEWMRLLAPPHGWHVRTYPSAALIVKPDGGAVICRAPSDGPECAEAAAWLDRAKIVARDLAFGERYTLELTSDSHEPPAAAEDLPAAAAFLPAVGGSNRRTELEQN